MNVFVTGASGCGKTTTAKLLSERDVGVVIDLDDIGVKLYDGQPTQEHMSDMDQEEFWEHVTYEIDIGALERRVKEASDAGMHFFGLGVAMNWEDVMNMPCWDARVLLDNKSCVKQRLRDPKRTNPWGQQDWQVAESEEFAKQLVNKPFDMVIDVCSTQPADVVDNLLENVETIIDEEEIEDEENAAMVE